MKTFKQFLDESINDKGIFKAIFVVGIPGAGKSYTISKLSGPVSPRVVNIDRASEYLAKKLKVPSTGDNWELFNDRAKATTIESVFHYVNGMLPLFVDGTSSSAEYIFARAGILESVGYDVGMVFIETDVEVAKQRAAERAKKIDREVSADFIEKVHRLSVQNKEYFKAKFAFFKELSNNPGELDNTALLKIYRQVAGFYTDPIQNPEGQRNLEQLRKAGEKYLVPTIFDENELNQKVKGWYRS